MANTMYAWSPILYDTEKDGEGNFLRHKTVPMGESVTKSKLGVDDAGWAELIESGAVRSYKVPEMPANYKGSVVDFLRNQAAQAEVLGVATSLGGSPFGPTTEEVMLSDDFEDLRSGAEAAAEESEEASDLTGAGAGDTQT